MENLKLTPETMDSLLVLVTQYGTKVLGAVLLIFIGFWLAGKLKRVTVAALTKSQMDATLTKFTGNIVRWAILVALGISLLGMFGVQTTSFAAVIAASGLAIGLAFQGSLSNLAAGIMLLIFRPFRVGQFIRGGVRREPLMKLSFSPQPWIPPTTAGSSFPTPIFLATPSKI